ncbi:CHAT domain-containing protein [Xanthobacter oligotrophicus]|uniref:CHAT domain-containing protein n=1 Tax=Xanthobacter oligotrophicus TaxID=2607286 RepID=UPI0011F1F6AA|nr:tetratricopeptide repeat protein [Xanthobacter oligotrophicus]MCG5237573.1 tetratricopeptide repeat protein [Xanthobacter oligotrophicus]
MVEDERAAFSRATALHREGRLDEALEIYLRLLKARPGVFEVERLVVFAHLQAGRIKDAHAAARRAKHGHSNNPHAHVLLGATLQAEHKWERALKAFEAAAKLDPGLVEARYLAGNMHANLGRHAEALACFDTALVLDPRAVEVLANRAQVRVRMGQSTEALADFTRLAELQPWEPAHFLAKGALLHEFGRSAEAAEAAFAALQLKPDLADAHFLIGQTFRAAGDLPAAREAFRIALAAAPNRPAFQVALAGIEHELGDVEMPAPVSVPAAAPEAGEPEAGTPEAGLEPAEVPHATGDLEAPQAATAATEAAEPSPAIPSAIPLATEPPAFEPGPPAAVEAERDRPPAAARPDAGSLPVAEDTTPVQQPSLPPEEVRRESLAPEALRQRALDALAEGRWQDGWAGLEACATGDASAQKPLPLPHWDGVEMPSALIVTAEGDLADLILFGRLLRLLADRRIPARLLAQAEHVPLLSRIDVRIPVASDLAGVDVRDARLRWTPLASLPRLMAPDPHGWPQAPYLLADPARIARWRDMRPDGFAVGIAWNGDLALLSAFAAMGSLEGVALVSLETRPEAEAELAATGFGRQVARLGPGWDAGGTLVDTAALIQHLDLVVTGEGPVAHLAGARGRPGLVAVGPVAHWCWGVDTATSAFYPSLDLVRAGRPDEWSDVGASLAASVAARRAAAR